MSALRWEAWKLAHAYPRIGSGTTPTSNVDDYYSDEVGVPWVTTGELRENYVEQTALRVTTQALKDFSALRVYQAGSLMIAMYGATIGRLGVTAVPAACNQACCVFESSEQFDNRFLFYWLWHRRRDLVALSTGGGQPNLSQQDLREERALCPPLETQQRIARFLDEKTARIDALIEKKQALLERLAEKRQSLITRAVTKGLNPDVPMKPSGVAWVDLIPAHWDSGNIRRFALMRTGHTPSRSVAEFWDDCTIPWFTLADVWQIRGGTRWYLGETSEKISELGLENSAAELLPTGTVILSRTASVGFSGIMPVPMATSQDFWNWVCSPKLLPEYLLLQFRAMADEFELSTNGSTHKTIYQGIAAGLRVCVPPIDEQRRIAEFLLAKTKEIDAARSKIDCSTDELRAYRSALITAAVTGQLAELNG